MAGGAGREGHGAGSGGRLGRAGAGRDTAPPLPEDLRELREAAAQLGSRGGQPLGVGETTTKAALLAAGWQGGHPAGVGDAGRATHIARDASRATLTAPNTSRATRLARDASRATRPAPNSSGATPASKAALPAPVPPYPQAEVGTPERMRSSG